METTGHLGLPYIMPSQAQALVTHNEALRMLDALVHLSVLDRDLSAPPAEPAEGDRHIIGAEASGDWEGKEGQIAARQDGAWTYFVPAEGWRAWVQAQEALFVFHEGGWEISGGGLDSDIVGINATADETNRLVVSSAAVLFNHEGAGQQVKVNKAAAGDTASLLFQTAFAGRAEMGTTGDDDFHVKVSADGAAWHEAMVIDGESGAVSFPNTQLQAGRERLAAARTYYVRADGNDANDGLADNAGGAFATVQRAFDVVYGTLDLGPFDVTIQLGDGTYEQSAAILAPHVGAGIVTLAGNASSPQDTVLAGEDGVRTLTLANNAALTIRDFELRGNGQAATFVSQGAALSIGSGMRFGPAVTAQLYAQDAGIIAAAGASYAVVGGSGRHLLAVTGSVINALNCTVTLVGMPVFSNAYAQADRTSVINANGSSFTGSATGTRYLVATNGVINTSGGGANYLPGNAAGSEASGGVYA